MKYVKMGTPKCKFLPYTLLKSRKNKLEREFTQTL